MYTYKYTCSYSTYHGNVVVYIHICHAINRDIPIYLCKNRRSYPGLSKFENCRDFWDSKNEFLCILNSLGSILRRFNIDFFYLNQFQEKFTRQNNSAEVSVLVHLMIVWKVSKRHFRLVLSWILAYVIYILLKLIYYLYNIK